VSGNDVKTQKLFKESHKLPFTLLADEKGEVAKTFGVPTKPGSAIKVKGPDGELETKLGVFISRWTFIIDKDGKIAYKNEKADTRADAKNVLEALEKLGK
jgi:peroxiredoxin Q/BCP